MIIIGFPSTALFPVLVAVEMTRRDVPDSITINKKEYRIGFYENLLPNNIEYTDETHVVKVKKFYKVNYEKFDLFHAQIDSAHGVLYVENSQWE